MNIYVSHLQPIPSSTHSISNPFHLQPIPSPTHSISNPFHLQPITTYMSKVSIHICSSYPSTLPYMFVSISSPSHPHYMSISSPDPIHICSSPSHPDIHSGRDAKIYTTTC